MRIVDPLMSQGEVIEGENGKRSVLKGIQPETHDCPALGSGSSLWGLLASVQHITVPSQKGSQRTVCKVRTWRTPQTLKFMWAEKWILKGLG